MLRIQPDFNRLLKALKREKTDRPVLFEFIINDKVIEHFAGDAITAIHDDLTPFRNHIHGFKNAGYDFAVVPEWHANLFTFPKASKHKEQSVSQNENAVITDRESFEKYPWPEVSDADYSLYEKLEMLVPGGMKLIPFAPGGVLENVTDLAGFENLCLMTLMDEQLASELFDAVGSRLLQHYTRLLQFDCVGAVMGNDDWGFKTQTMLDRESMRKYVIPWHRKIVEKVHASGKVAIMHSCGNLAEVMDDIIDDIGYDGKHSFEDGINPVEEAYRLWGSRIAIMGGIDVDFLSRSSENEIYKRARKLIEQTFDQGGYCLGSGNSIPEFVPLNNYMAMLKAAWDMW